MTTLLDIQNSVSQRLLDPNAVAVSSSSVVSAINDSIAYWKFRRFWFNEVHDTAALAAHDGSFPYPSDFLVPATQNDGFYIQYSNMRYPLSKITQAQYDAIYLNNGYGIPRWYARIGNDEYQCYPLPDRDYTVGRHYLKQYDALVNSTDENDFTNHATRLITLWSLANLMAELRQDDKMETYYRQAANDEYRNLRVMSDKSNGSGQLTISSIL